MEKKGNPKYINAQFGCQENAGKRKELTSNLSPFHYFPQNIKEPPNPNLTQVSFLIINTTVRTPFSSFPPISQQPNRQTIPTIQTKTK